MKKMIFGLALMVTGFVCTAMIIMAIVLSPLNPYSYNGVEGWWGILLGMNLQLPFLFFICVSIVGFVICVIEAFVRREK